MKLRPYQQEAIAQIEGHFNSGTRSVLYQLPTGGGKTVVFSSIITKWVKDNKRVCVLVHRVELLNQAAHTLRKLGINSGRIKGKERYDHRHLVHVASVQTLSRNKSAYPPDLFDLLVVDEAHHAVAGSWDRVIKRFNTAKILGVSATPCRLDGRGLGNAFDVLIEGPQPVTLSEQGFLAPAKVYAPPPKFEPGKLKTRMGDFQLDDASSQLSAVHVIGDVITHYKKHLKGSTAIAFCCSIAHAESVAAALTKAGIPSASIDGSMSEGQRASLLAQLASKSIKVLTSCALIGEGVDVPSVGGCILLRPTKSLALFLQMVGRCLRPDGDSFAVVLDHVGNYQRLGHHLLERSWSLADGVSLSQAAKTQDGTTGWLCQSCDFLAPKNCDQCPECGTPRPVTEKEIVTIEADLVEVEQIIPVFSTPQERKELMEYCANNATALRTDELIQLTGVTEKSINRLYGGKPRRTIGEYMLKVEGIKPRKGKPDDRRWFIQKRSERDWSALNEAINTCDSLEELVEAGERYGAASPRQWAANVMWHRREKAIRDIVCKLECREARKQKLQSRRDLPDKLQQEFLRQAQEIVGSGPVKALGKNYSYGFLVA